VSETRRSFLEGTLATAALAGMASPAQAQSRADVTIGIIGAGIRGLELMGVALEAGAKVAMVCDLYDGHFRRAQELQRTRRPRGTSTKYLRGQIFRLYWWQLQTTGTRR
jgi:hypothetical protein